jgi:hypothetical protein
MDNSIGPTSWIDFLKSNGALGGGGIFVHIRRQPPNTLRNFSKFFLSNVNGRGSRCSRNKLPFETKLKGTYFGNFPLRQRCQPTRSTDKRFLLVPDIMGKETTKETPKCPLLLAFHVSKRVALCGVKVALW